MICPTDNGVTNINSRALLWRSWRKLAAAAPARLNASAANNQRWTTARSPFPNPTLLSASAKLSSMITKHSQPHFVMRAAAVRCWSQPTGFRSSARRIFERKSDFQKRGAKKNWRHHNRRRDSGSSCQLRWTRRAVQSKSNAATSADNKGIWPTVENKVRIVTGGNRPETPFQNSRPPNAQTTSPSSMKLEKRVSSGVPRTALAGHNTPEKTASPNRPPKQSRRAKETISASTNGGS